jgi:hypothetical protein
VGKGFQVIKFVLLDFDANWDRLELVTSYANIRYTAIKKDAKLAVVFEGATGVMTTYHFLLDAKDEVFVVDQVVHIPSRCQSQAAGNTVSCRG